MSLKELRLQRGLTQQEVADRIGCSSIAYSRYERGEREPSVEMLLRMADVFGVTVDELLGREAIQHTTLSGLEIEVITAMREADSRAKHDALVLLREHKRTSGKKGTKE